MVSAKHKRRLEVQQKIIEHFESQLPAFTDIFDERTFYICFGVLVVVCIVVAALLAYFCDIKDADEVEAERERRKRKKQIEMVEKLIKKRMERAGIDPSKVNFKKVRELEAVLAKLKEMNADDEELLKNDELNQEEDESLLDLTSHKESKNTSNTSLSTESNQFVKT